MAKNFQCDGCKTSVEMPQVLGLALKRDYCPECAEKANNFLETQEVLRKACLDKFTEDREALIARFEEGGFLLPDVVK